MGKSPKKPKTRPDDIDFDKFERPAEPPPKPEIYHIEVER